MSQPDCPLCGGQSTRPFFRDRRDYFQCDACRLVFVAAADFLELSDERQHYDRHENSPDDLRYRQFLSRLCDPLCERLSPASSGLDFGSGPGPTLSVMLAERGHTVSLFDPYYAPDRSVLDRDYDFITATEVFEHLHRPAEELNRLWEILAPGGWLAVMTKRVIGPTEFATWHYKDDPTHVCFFSTETFEWLADKWGARLAFPGPDTVLLQKPN